MKQAPATVTDVTIQFEQVDKVFNTPKGPVQVLEDINLSIEKGSFVTMLGPSGCGKSTTLKLTAGLTPPTRGRVLFHGNPVTHLNTEVGFVTQELGLFPWLTLLENVAFPLEARGVPKAEREDKAREYIERVGLAGFEDAYPHELSGGMQKRGDIIRTLIYDPEVLLMDEPYGPLDAQTRLVMQQELLDLWSESGKTIVFVTHDLAEAINLSDKIVVMTKRPARVKAVIDVPIPRPRQVFNLQEDPLFHDIYREVWHQLKDEIAVPRRKRAGGEN